MVPRLDFRENLRGGATIMSPRKVSSDPMGGAHLPAPIPASCFLGQCHSFMCQYQNSVQYVVMKLYGYVNKYKSSFQIIDKLKKDPREEVEVRNVD